MLFFIENLPDLFETLGTIYHIYVFSLDESETLWSMYRALLSFTRSPKGKGPKFLKQASKFRIIFLQLSLSLCTGHRHYCNCGSTFSFRFRFLQEYPLIWRSRPMCFSRSLGTLSLMKANCHINQFNYHP